MKVINESDRKSNFKFFLDGEKGVLLDFTKEKNLMMSTVRYLCDNVTTIKEKDSSYYIDDYKYLDKNEMLKYIDETFDQIRNGVIKGQTYLCCDYFGNYVDIIKTYKKMLDEIRLKKYEIIGIPIEQCIDDSINKENNHIYVIRIMIPIRTD